MERELEKPCVIEAIRRINPSAHREWLESFTAPDLHQYLDRLEKTLESRNARRTPARPARRPGARARVRHEDT